MQWTSHYTKRSLAASANQSASRQLTKTRSVYGAEMPLQGTTERTARAWTQSIAGLHSASVSLSLELDRTVGRPSSWQWLMISDPFWSRRSVCAFYDIEAPKQLLRLIFYVLHRSCSDYSKNLGQLSKAGTCFSSDIPIGMYGFTSDVSMTDYRGIS